MTILPPLSRVLERKTLITHADQYYAGVYAEID